MIKSGENIVFFQKAKQDPSIFRFTEVRTNPLNAVLELAQSPKHFQIAICQGLTYSLFGEYWIRVWHAVELFIMSQVSPQRLYFQNDRN